jgi:3-oxoacyl-[acyl-carrier-protein] synthase-1
MAAAPTPRPLTGYSLATGLGRSTEENLAAIFAGRAAFGPPAEPFAVGFPTVCLTATGLRPLPAAFSAEDTRVHRLAWAALEELRPAADRARARWGAARVAVLVGTSTGGLESTERAFAQRGADGALPPWFVFEGMHPAHRVATFAAAALELAGPTYTVSTACSSSAKAVASALRLLQSELCDAVVVGGVDSLCNTTLRGFAALGLLAPGPCRPFDAERAGLNLGEAAAFLLLERDGAAPVRVASAGETMEAHHLSAPDPTGRGMRAPMEEALRRAGVAPRCVGYVNAHGTATPQNDAAEARALLSLFGDGPAVSSTKGVTGHTLGAAGAVELVVTARALERQVLPPNAGLTTPCPEAQGLRLVREPTPAALRYALSASFAFGGSSAAVLLEATP